MNNYYLNIADIKIHIKSPFKINIVIESKDFIYKGKDKDILLEYIGVKSPICVKGTLIYEDRVRFYKTDKGFIHELCSESKKEPYAWIIPLNKNHYKVKYLLGEEDKINYSRNIIEIMNIEKVLSTYNTILLHSSFIYWNKKGILFSAPSGTGKSTQADLWKKYEDAEIINGDRAGIKKKDGKWNAYGLPIAGTSGIYKNKKAELSHIIILKQGKENNLKRLSPREAFIKIYSETIIHTWDMDFQNNVVNIITDLVKSVPIYQYECLPDKSAVDFLKKQIMEDNKKIKFKED